MKKEIIELFEKQGKKLKGVHPETIKDWKKGTHQMKVERVESVLLANKLPEPFFWDGTMQHFLQYATECAVKLGQDLKLEILIKK
jgi:hypothetical protein